MGLPMYSTTFLVNCGDNGENGEWNNFAYMFGTAINEITGDEAARDWIQDQVLNYYIAFVENGNESVTFKETYEGNGFTMEIHDNLGGFGYALVVSSVD